MPIFECLVVMPTTDDEAKKGFLEEELMYRRVSRRSPAEAEKKVLLTEAAEIKSKVEALLTVRGAGHPLDAWEDRVAVLVRPFEDCRR